MNQTFTVVNDAVMASLILSAREKIVYVAPGVSTAVAKALCDRFPDVGSLAITLILDVDPEIYRLGYGDAEGLELIKDLADENFIVLRQQAGVRIGLLITDEKTIIYSPTPHLIEAGSVHAEKPNAIVLDITPESIDRACASGTESLPLDAEIGKEFIRAADLEKIRTDLRDRPPKPFDLARLERVFSSRIQYVELELTKYKLSKRAAPIPADLLGLADDPATSNRWKNSFRMFDGDQKIKVEIPVRDDHGNPITDERGEPLTREYGEAELEADRRQIERDYFYKVTGFGVVVFRNRRTAFNKRYRELERAVQDYAEAVGNHLDTAIEESIGRLAKVLLPLVREKVPDRYLKAGIAGRITDADLMTVLKDDLRANFGAIQDRTSPQVKVQFKDISYETISNEEFHKALGHAGIPDKVLTDLFSEYDAAPESLREDKAF